MQNHDFDCQDISIKGKFIFAPNEAPAPVNQPVSVRAERCLIIENEQQANAIINIIKDNFYNDIENIYCIRVRTLTINEKEALSKIILFANSIEYIVIDLNSIGNQW